MKGEINWLLGIEQTAGRLYREAADFFREDDGLAAFLSSLAEDEAWHFHIMGSAAEYLRTHHAVAPLELVFDDATREKINAPFVENYRQMKEGCLSKDSILACVAATEFSEWNDLFLYVVNALKEESREFQYVAARMQEHLHNITDFLEKRPEAAPLLAKVRDLPRVWREHILIVEDSEPLREILESILNREFRTTTAENGRTGLEKTRGNYFDVIISDIRMPEMDGITFYREACKHDPDIGSRFLFFSGHITDEHRDFLHSRQIPYLLKPGALLDLNEKIEAVLERNRRGNAENAG